MAYKRLFGPECIFQRMKKVLLLLAALTVSLSGMAQFRWGVTAGTNFTNYRFKQDLVHVSTLAGVDAGVMGELMFPGIGFGVDFGLRYSMHGSKVNFGQRKIWASDGIGNETCYVHTIQIPINLRFKYTNLNGVERIVAPFVFGGPLFSITAGHSEARALEYPGGSFMLQCGIGAELFEKFQITCGYYWGLTYEARTIKLDNFSARPEGWTIGVAYLF